VDLVRQLREKAERCYRLARGITCQRDADLLNSLGDEAEHAAADREVAITARAPYREAPADHP
jgi:hypothetical protein